MLLFVAVDEFAVATTQWLTSLGGLLLLWFAAVASAARMVEGISVTALGSQFWVFARSGTGAAKGICFALRSTQLINAFL